MGTTIRTLEPGEFTEFMRFLERCYGHSFDYFSRQYPHLYHAEERNCAWYHVLEENGRIAGHVGIFPLSVHVCGIDLDVGGIGGVATLPAARGRGHMGALLNHAMAYMRDRGFALSALSGDRQRYGAFGWEHVTDTLQLTLSRRSLARAGIKAVAIEEVASMTAYPVIVDLYHDPAIHAVRPWLADQLDKPGLRFFLADDGYAIATGEERVPPRVLEVVSRRGEEAGIIQSVLNLNGGSHAVLELSPWDRERVERVLPAACRWSTHPAHMYRVVDLCALLGMYKTLMENGLSPYSSWSVGITLEDGDVTQVATVGAEAGTMRVSEQDSGDLSITRDPCGLVRLLFGGPVAPSVSDRPSVLHQALPLPIHIPPLDAF